MVTSLTWFLMRVQHVASPNNLELGLEVALFALKINLVFFLYVVPHFLPLFSLNSHREHCTRGIIFASGRVIPFFAKRTGEARGR